MNPAKYGKHYKDAPVSEEDRVIYLLASLTRQLQHDCYSSRDAVRECAKMVTGDQEASAPRGKHEGERCPRWRSKKKHSQQAASKNEGGWNRHFQVPFLWIDWTFQPWLQKVPGHSGKQSKQIRGHILVTTHVLSDAAKHFDYDVKKSIGFCETSVGGKHRAPFMTNTTKTTVPLKLVHSDVCGKMQQRSLGGAEYFLIFTDDHTKYSWLYILKTKNQVFECFREWKALVEKQTKHKLKMLRTDNGGEYTSKKFEQYLRSEGICHEKMVPITPEQNRVSKRLNRTPIEAARWMLLDASLSKVYWAEAVIQNTAEYVKNRSPTKVLQGKTPFEAWYGKKPNV